MNCLLIGGGDYSFLQSANISLFDRIYTSYVYEERVIGKAYVRICSSSKYVTQLKNLMRSNQTFTGIGPFVGCIGDTWDIGGAHYIEASRNPTSTYYTPCKYFWGEHGLSEAGVGSESYYWTEFEHNSQSSNRLIDGSTNLDNIYTHGFDNYFKNIMRCPFTFMFFDGDDQQHDYIMLGKFGSNTRYLGDGTYDIENANDFTNSFCRVWWIDEEGNPCILNPNARISSLTGYSYGAGLFGLPELRRQSEEDKIDVVYSQILDFIGTNWSYYSSSIQDNIADGVLIAPIDNLNVTAYYPSPTTYLFYEKADITINPKLIYNVTTTLNTSFSNQNQNSILWFGIETNKTKEIQKELSYTYNLNTDFSQSAFDISQRRLLSNYSIFVDSDSSTIILSDWDTRKYLYMGKDLGSSNINQIKKLSEGAIPISLGTGSRYSFPVVCRKVFNPTTYRVSSPIMGLSNGNYQYAKVFSEFRPDTQSIPVFYANDKTLPANFFT